MNAFRKKALLLGAFSNLVSKESVPNRSVFIIRLNISSQGYLFFYALSAYKYYQSQKPFLATTFLAMQPKPSYSVQYPSDKATTSYSVVASTGNSNINYSNSTTN